MCCGCGVRAVMYVVVGVVVVQSRMLINENKNVSVFVSVLRGSGFVSIVCADEKGKALDKFLLEKPK